MTVFNSISKIGRRFVCDLENLYLRLLEQSKISKEIDFKILTKDKGKYNTVSKLRRRKISEIQGLKAGVVQLSCREYNSTIDMLNKNVNTTNYNSFKRLTRRNYKELNNLYIRIVENSYRALQTTLKGFKLIKPNKTYKNKIKLIKKYNNNIKY